jgi:hypothetical protein
LAKKQTTTLKQNGLRRKSEKETKRVKAFSQDSQRAWMNGDGVKSRKISWQELMQSTGHSSFQLKAMSNTLPTPSNMTRWRLLDDPR